MFPEYKAPAFLGVAISGVVLLVIWFFWPDALNWDIVAACAVSTGVAFISLFVDDKS